MPPYCSCDAHKLKKKKDLKVYHQMQIQLLTVMQVKRQVKGFNPKKKTISGASQENCCCTVQSDVITLLQHIE